MVVGCGTLGNEVLKNLAMLGAGTIVAVDFDNIEKENIYSSALFAMAGDCIGKPKVIVASEIIKRINPEIEVIPLNVDFCYGIGLGLIQSMDMVISCVDNRWTRYIINRYCMAVGTPWIDGGISEFEGSVKAFSPGKGCYACLIGDAQQAEMSLRFSCPGIVRRNIRSAHAPVNPLIASFIGALQVQEAFKIISNLKDNTSIDTSEGKIISFDGKNLSLSVSSFKAWDEECIEHQRIEKIKDCGLLTSDSIKDTLAKINLFFNSSDASFSLDRQPFVSEVISMEDDKSFPVMKPASQVENFITLHPELRGLPIGLYRQTEWSVIDSSFLWQNMTLKDLGIPSEDILTVFANGDEHYFYVK